MSFREAMPPRTTHQGLCPSTPLGDFRSPDPLCPHLQILATPLALIFTAISCTQIICNCSCYTYTSNSIFLCLFTSITLSERDCVQSYIEEKRNRFPFMSGFVNVNIMA